MRKQPKTIPAPAMPSTIGGSRSCPTLRVGFVAPAPAPAQDRRVALLAGVFGFDLSDVAMPIELCELTEIGAFEAMQIESGDLLGAL